MLKNINDCLDANEGFVPSLVHEHLKDATLPEIAGADRGEYVDVHLPALREFWNGALPPPMGDLPEEVLELTVGHDPTRERPHGQHLFVGLTLPREAQPPQSEHFRSERSYVVDRVTTSLSMGGDE